jgi:hypothetical protein
MVPRPSWAKIKTFPSINPYIPITIHWCSLTFTIIFHCTNQTYSRTFFWPLLPKAAFFHLFKWFSIWRWSSGRLYSRASISLACFIHVTCSFVPPWVTISSWKYLISICGLKTSIFLCWPLCFLINFIILLTRKFLFIFWRIYFV